MTDTLITLNRSDNIAILTLNRTKALNALNLTMLEELKQKIAIVERDSKIKTLIITGAGKAFVAGADIVEMEKLKPLQARAFAASGALVFRMIEQLNKPVIAAVNGFALGGGCELAMSADIRLASTKAQFGQPEVGLGIIPGFAGTQRLPRLVGLAKAKELIFTGNRIDAYEALQIGLVNGVYEPTQLMNMAITMAKEIAVQSASAVSLAKKAINIGFDLCIEAGTEHENNMFGLCFDTIDQHEGMAAFRERRNADFSVNSTE